LVEKKDLNDGRSKIINTSAEPDPEEREENMIRFKSHNVGSLQLPTLGNYRRVHNDGLLMLDNHYNLKEMEDKAKIMENRLKRLNDQEAKAIKNQKIAEKKASDMLLARGRHYNDMMNKMRFMHEKNA
jgi:hypothetical protein